jgi:hypothetical protein
MSTHSLTLADLISPIARETFFTQCWEMQPLHVRRSRSDYYDPLLTITQLEGLIASRETRYPAVQLSKSWAYFPP